MLVKGPPVHGHVDGFLFGVPCSVRGRLRNVIDVLIQERRNSIADALELRLSCTEPSIHDHCLSVGLRGVPATSLQWRHNEPNGVSNHRGIDCSLNRLFRRRSTKTAIGEIPAQRDSNPEKVSIWWRHQIPSHFWTRVIPSKTKKTCTHLPLCVSESGQHSFR